jgi:hypothetical protein
MISNIFSIEKKFLTNTEATIHRMRKITTLPLAFTNYLKAFEITDGISFI